MRSVLLSSAFALLLSGPGFASAAELALTPASGAIETGSAFEVAVVLRSDEPVTAAEATLSFDAAAFEVEKIDIDDSILVTWPTQPLFSNDRGTIQFSGSADAPFTGEAGTIMTVTLRATGNGSHELRFDDGAVLSTTGSNIVSSLVSGVYRVAPLSTVASESDTPLSEPVAPQTENIPMPLIQKEGTELSIGDRLVVRGLVIPDVLVHITVEPSSGETQTYTVPSAGDGSFTFVSDFRASEGVYRVSAVAEGRGMEGPRSETVSYTVRALGLAAAAGTAVDVMTLALPLLALASVIGLCIAFVLSRRR